jgi:hypothetical protein
MRRFQPVLTVLIGGLVVLGVWLSPVQAGPTNVMCAGGCILAPCPEQQEGNDDCLEFCQKTTMVCLPGPCGGGMVWHECQGGVS